MQHLKDFAGQEQPWRSFSAVVRFLSCLVFHFGFFKCEDNFTNVVGMWWLLTSSGSVTAGPAQDVCVAVKRKCSGRMRASMLGDTERPCSGLHCGRWRPFEERRPVEREAELDVTQGCHTNDVTVIG